MAHKNHLLPLIYVIYGKEKAIFKILSIYCYGGGRLLKYSGFLLNFQDFYGSFLYSPAFRLYKVDRQVWIFTFWHQYFSRVLTNWGRYVKRFLIHCYIETIKNIPLWHNELFSTQRSFFKKLTADSVFIMSSWCELPGPLKLWHDWSNGKTCRKWG